jgi:hypothetical protein
VTKFPEESTCTVVTVVPPVEKTTSTLPAGAALGEDPRSTCPEIVCPVTDDEFELVENFCTIGPDGDGKGVGSGAGVLVGDGSGAVLGPVSEGDGVGLATEPACAGEAKPVKGESTAAASTTIARIVHATEPHRTTNTKDCSNGSGYLEQYSCPRRI